MKRLVSIVAVVLVFAVPAFALSDAEYLRMKKSSADFKVEAYTKATEERAEELYHIFQMYMKGN